MTIPYPQKYLKDIDFSNARDRLYVVKQQQQQQPPPPTKKTNKKKTHIFVAHKSSKYRWSQ